MAIKKTIDAAAGTVTWDFGDDAPVVVATLDAIPADIIRRLALHGLSQKGGDSYAGAKSAVDDGDATSVEAYARECVGDVIQTLIAGKWSERAAGTGAPRLTVLVEAYMRRKGLTEAEARERIGQLDETQQAAARKALAKEINEIKMKRLAKKAAAAGTDADLDKIGL